MVYMSGSKNARYSASISNRTNVCGGIKKSGIASRIGLFMQSNPNLIGAPQSVPKTCEVSKVIQTQKYGYRATHGGNMG
jgi:hypothetical protein